MLRGTSTPCLLGRTDLGAAFREQNQKPRYQRRPGFDERLEKLRLPAIADRRTQASFSEQIDPVSPLLLDEACTPAEKRGLPRQARRLARAAAAAAAATPTPSATPRVLLKTPPPTPTPLARRLTWNSEEQQSPEPSSPLEPSEASKAAAPPPPAPPKLRRMKTWAPNAEVTMPSAEDHLSPTQSCFQWPTTVSPKAAASASAAATARVVRNRHRHKTWATPADTGPGVPALLSPPLADSITTSSSGEALDSPESSKTVSPSGTRKRDMVRHLLDGPKNWVRGERIGCGSYGTVFKALDRESGLIFAVKEAVWDETSIEDSKYKQRLEEELTICRELRHKHIVSYLGHEFSDSCLHLFLEYVSGGSMASVLKEFGPLTAPLQAKGTRGMLKGLDYLHTRQPPVVHRDIKGANVLVDLNFCVRLADFGCSKRASDTKSFTTIGSIPWMAPEVIKQSEGYGRKADVWSLGCTIIEMASAEKPWGSKTFDNVVFALQHIGMSEEVPPIPEALPDAGRDLVAQCCSRDPDVRPWANELLKHDFVSRGASPARSCVSVRSFAATPSTSSTVTKRLFPRRLMEQRG